MINYYSSSFSYLSSIPTSSLNWALFKKEHLPITATHLGHHWRQWASFCQPFQPAVCRYISPPHHTPAQVGLFNTMKSEVTTQKYCAQERKNTIFTNFYFKVQNNFEAPCFESSSFQYLNSLLLPFRTRCRSCVLWAVQTSHYYSARQPYIGAPSSWRSH